jgi:hypothetical protein
MIPEIKSTVSVKAPHKGAKQVLVYGHRDPRGPDNNIFVWVDEDGRLRIRVLKTERCYKFEQMIDTPGFVEIVAI